MSKAILTVFVLTLTFLFGGTTRAEDVSYVIKSCCDACGAGKCDGGCGGCSGWVAEFEAVFLRYNRGDGVRVGSTVGQDVNFDYEFAPRFSVGWITANDMGFRVRYFDFDHSTLAINAVDSISVDAAPHSFRSASRCSVIFRWSDSPNDHVPAPVIRALPYPSFASIRRTMASARRRNIGCCSQAR